MDLGLESDGLYGRTAVLRRISIAVIVLATGLAAVAADTPRPCSGSEYGALDFWVGTWDVVNEKGELEGRNQLEKVLHGCAIIENWKEVSGSPTYCNDDPALAVQQLNDLTTAHPDLNAVVPVGGWPLFVPEGYRNFVGGNADRFKNGTLVAVAADTLPSELLLLKAGYVAALVGQRPFEMGEKAMDALLALHDGKPAPQIIHTGVDRVTKENIGEFLK